MGNTMTAAIEPAIGLGLFSIAMLGGLGLIFAGKKGALVGAGLGAATGLWFGYELASGAPLP
jgi:hypothetical protein